MRFCFWFFRHFRKHFSSPAVTLTRTCRARSLRRFDRRPRSLLAELLYIDRDDNNINFYHRLRLSMRFDHRTSAFTVFRLQLMSGTYNM